jgi:hypothetical protein
MVLIFIIIIFSFFSGKGKNTNVNMEGLESVGVEANVSVDVNAIPTSGKQKGKCGRPRKTTMDVDLDQLVKDLLSDIERSESEEDDLFYDKDEVIREKDGTTHWWEEVDLGINDTRDNFGIRKPTIQVMVLEVCKEVIRTMLGGGNGIGNSMISLS